MRLYVVLAGWSIFTLYTSLLPFLASSLDENDDNSRCSAVVQCAQGDSFSLRTGSNIGCGCGEGIFGQSVCAVDEGGGWGFTIEQFIATPFATQLFLLFSALPLFQLRDCSHGTKSVFATVDGGNLLPSRLYLVFEVALGLWVLHYLLVYGGTFCVYSSAHEVLRGLLTAVGLCYTLGVAVSCMKFVTVFDNHTRAVIMVNVAAALFFAGVFLFGFLYKFGDDTSVNYGPWICQTLALVCLFAVAPMNLLRSARMGDLVTQPEFVAQPQPVAKPKAVAQPKAVTHVVMEL